MTSTAPDWLTRDYVEKALRTYYKDADLTVLELAVIPALAPGENFGGVLTRLHVKFEHCNQVESQHLIVKTAIDDDALAQQLMAPYDIYRREITLYAEVLPKLQQLLMQLDSEPIFPTAVHIDQERLSIMFEDLTLQGYVMADRIKRLDSAHVQLILCKLAKMHAASAVLNERQAGSLECYDRGFFNQYTNGYSGYFVGGLLAAARWLSQTPDLAHYAQKLFDLAPHYMDIGKACFAPTPGHVNVLAHGDVWTNNVMFKYDPKTSKPIDVLLIDFQYAFWGSPTIDLHHLFSTSLQEELRRDQQNKLFQFYHDVFTSTLRGLHYQQQPIPSLHRFLLQVEQKRFFAVHSTVVVQPVMINEDPTDACFNALMNDDERGTRFKNRLYNNPVVQDILRTLLPVFDSKGLLEVNQCA